MMHMPIPYLLCPYHDTYAHTMIPMPIPWYICPYHDTYPHTMIPIPIPWYLCPYHDTGGHDSHDSPVLDDSASFRIRHNEVVQLLEVRLHRVTVVTDHTAGKVLPRLLLNLRRSQTLWHFVRVTSVTRIDSIFKKKCWQFIESLFSIWHNFEQFLRYWAKCHCFKCLNIEKMT